MNTSSMFHRPAKLLVAGSLLFAALLAGQTAFAQSMINSKHDLSSGSTSGGVKSTSTTEVCVFCHTPHGADNKAPLWNRNPTLQTFTYYTSASMNSPLATPTTIGLQSTMCLSCHDGVTALNSLINSPGSGAGTAPTMSGTFPATTANLGIALNNDHPIGIPFCGGFNALLTAAPAGCVDKDFKLTALVKSTVSQSAAFTAGTSTDTWWLDITTTGNTAGTRDKSDLPLYINATNLVPTVQCATCHEPHNANGTTSMVSFLRTPNDKSIICTTCHAK